MVIIQHSPGPGSQYDSDHPGSGLQRSRPVSAGNADAAMPRQHKQSAVGRLKDFFMRGTCIAGRKRRREEMEGGMGEEEMGAWALTGMVGDGNGFGNGFGNGNANGFGNTNGVGNANGFENGGGAGNGNENGIDGHLHDGDGDVDMDGADAIDGDVTMHGAIAMDAMENGAEHTEPQNGYEDHDEAPATASVCPSPMHTTHNTSPYTPHRSAPLPDPHQMVPPTVHSAATWHETSDYSGSIQLPRPQAVSGERERWFGSSAGEMLACGCYCEESLGEEECRWVYCWKHQRVGQEEEDEDVEAGTTVPMDGDGGEPEPPRGRSRYRY